MAFNDRGNSFRGGNRDSNRGGGGGFGGGNSGPREMTKVTCSDCGVETEVPFKPTWFERNFGLNTTVRTGYFGHFPGAAVAASETTTTATVAVSVATTE